MMSRRSTSSLDGGDRMTATEELRAELTRRGIEWRWEDERTTYWYVTVDGEEWGEWTAIEMGGYLHLSFSSGDVLTPEQAIAATLGSGTCKNVHEPPKDTTFWQSPHFKCSECGATHVSMEYVFYCPNCGRKVVDK